MEESQFLQQEMAYGHFQKKREIKEHIILLKIQWKLELEQEW